MYYSTLRFVTHERTTEYYNRKRDYTYMNNLIKQFYHVFPSRIPSLHPCQVETYYHLMCSLTIYEYINSLVNFLIHKFIPIKYSQTLIYQSSSNLTCRVYYHLQLDGKTARKSKRRIHMIPMQADFNNSNINFQEIKPSKSFSIQSGMF